MKKSRIILLALICIISIAVLAACDFGGDAQTLGMEGIIEKYEATSQATLIEQSIEIEKDGKMVRSYQKTLTKTEEGYDVAETEKKLNSVSVDNIPDAQYNETTKNYTLKAAEGTAKLKLEKEYFNTLGFTMTETTLKGVVKDGSVEEFLSISEELPAEIKGLSVEITADETGVTSIKLSYSSEGYLVNISLDYTY